MQTNARKFFHAAISYTPCNLSPTFSLSVYFIPFVQALNNDEEMANQLSLDVARLSSHNTALLKQLSKSTVLHYKVTAYLRRKAHQVRVGWCSLLTNFLHYLLPISP